MRVLRQIQCGVAWCFALMAVLLVRAAILPLLAGPGHSLARLALPVGLAALFLTAWWRVLRRRDAARRWALAASFAPVAYALWAFFYFPDASGLLHVLAFPLAAGTLGLAVFYPGGRRGAPVHVPRAGDGTGVVANLVGPALAAAFALESSTLWTRWAAARGLPLARPCAELQVLGTVLLVLAVHEAGHALAGMALGMGLTGFEIGPLTWRLVEGRWRFRWKLRGLVFFLGATAMVPRHMDGFRARKMMQVAAGPLASVAGAAVAMMLTLRAPGHGWAALWRASSEFCTISCVSGLLNLVPFGVRGAYSDGARLLQLGRGGSWAEYHRLLGEIGSASVTSLRPRDFNLAAIERAAAELASPAEALHLRLSAFAAHLDRGELEQAAHALESAEAISRESALEPPIGSCGAFIFLHACVRRDADAARTWWNRMTARAPRRSEQFWLSRCALLLSEDRHDEARDAWRRAEAWTRQLPQTGIWETERHLVRLLATELQPA